MGCFAFNPVVLQDEYRQEWYYDWPFYRAGESKMSDIWKKPDADAANNQTEASTPGPKDESALN